MKRLLLLPLLILAGCATVGEREFLQIWDEQVQCFSRHLDKDVSPLLVPPFYQEVDFQVCPGIEGNTNGCAFIFEANEGDTVQVGRRGKDPVIYTVGVDVPLFKKRGRTFAAFILIEEGKTYPTLAEHEAVHILLGELFTDAGDVADKRKAVRGFGDIDPDHGSLYFSDNAPCPHGFELF